MERMWTSQRKQKREGNSVQRIDDKYATETGDKIFKRRRNNLLKFISIHDTEKKFNPIKTFGWLVVCFVLFIGSGVPQSEIIDCKCRARISFERVNNNANTTNKQSKPPKKCIFIFILISISMGSVGVTLSYSANKDETEKNTLLSSMNFLVW